MSDPIAQTDAYLDAIAVENPRLNAFVRVTDNLARAQAADAAATVTPLSPVHGWCIAIKDNIDVCGVPTSNGLPGDEAAMADAAVVERLKDGGAVILGKTNLHEAAFGSTTNNPHWGATHNPHRHGYIAGGSSGGSAAAVAAGLCDAALGSDTMGSIRLPAGHCGVVGFKPTFDALPTQGIAPLCRSLDHVGPITRSVADARAMFETLAQTSASADAHGGPRIVQLSSFGVIPLEDTVARAYAESLRRIADRYGPVLTADLPGFDPVALRHSALLAIEADAASIHAGQFDRASPELRKLLAYGAQLPEERLAAAQTALSEASDAVHKLFESVDIIVSPTTPMTAFPFDQPMPKSHVDFLGLAVFAGAPAISLPMPMGEGELPAGLQLIAAPGHDFALLNWAEAIEETLKHG